MKSSVIACFLVLSACAGSDVLPQLGRALLLAREAYVSADKALEKTAQVAELVCKEPEPVTVNMCADAMQSLEVADRAADTAHAALTVATQLYNAVNGADDADAGSP